MTTQDPSQVAQTLPELKNLVNNLLILLSPKERHIIENRFSLNSHPRATLEKIGKEFGVTRERVRQIEKNALRKLQRNVGNTKLNLMNQYGGGLIQKYDGVVLEEKLVNEILTVLKDASGVDVSSIKLSLQLDSQLEKIHNTIFLKPYWKTKSVTKREILDVCEKSIKFLDKKPQVVPPEELLTHLNSALPKRVSKTFVISCLELDRRIKIVKGGQIGLSTWRNINPRTLRDKILYILGESKKPLHFVEISNRISAAHFDNKVVNVQAVHNELIRNPQFVLIGRGIYALKEWGYKEGTVSDIIEDILKKQGPMDRDKIIEQVLKQRQVKRITILLNLKNKTQFERVGRNVYTLKNSP